MSYVIETGVPLPTDGKGSGGRKRGPSTPWTQALDAMHPWQSAFTPEWSDVKAVEKMRLYRPDRKYSVRKVQVPERGWRVWRIE